MRLWQGGEFYFDPELAQGFGLNGTLGFAGFPNGEAQKAGAAFPKIRAQRYYFKQTFGLGGEQEDVADGPNQLAGKRDIDRVTLIVGRFAVGDFFDNNAYAHDPRADFMNWAMWASGAYDFPADLPGYTRGAVVELNRKDWAVRAGVFEVPSQPNSDMLTFKACGARGRIRGALRHLRASPASCGSAPSPTAAIPAIIAQALAIAAADPALDINAVMTGIRHDNPKYGFYANLEQQIVQDVGLFARASWNDGQNEILSFTDIDRSLSGGVSIKGSFWGRPNDTVGIGGAVNGLSRRAPRLPRRRRPRPVDRRRPAQLPPRADLRDLLCLRWSTKGVTLTADYQFITNPAYNADRGPVSIFSGRLHGEFSNQRQVRWRFRISAPPALGQALRPNIWDIVALILVIGAMVLIVYGGEQTTLPLSALDVSAGVARSVQSAALRAAHHAADAAGDRLLDHLHLHLCGAGRQEPARRDGADPAARHPAVGADPRLPDLHGRVLHEPVSRPACWAPSSPACSRSSPARPGT